MSNNSDQLPCRIYIDHAQRTFQKKDSLMKPYIVQNYDKFKDGLKRLKEFTKEEIDLDIAVAAIGIEKNDRYIKLNLINHADIYDLVDIYELGARLKFLKGDWEATWKTIESEMCAQGDDIGPATPETISKFRKSFDLLMTEFKTNFQNLEFHRLMWDTKENKLILV